MTPPNQHQTGQIKSVSLSHFEPAKIIRNAEAKRLVNQGADMISAFDAGSAGLVIDLVWVPSGEFLMGSPEDEHGRCPDETLHKVTISKGFWMAKTPITQQQWIAVRGLDKNPSTFGRHRDIPGGIKNHPVDAIGWKDAVYYCRMLNHAAQNLLPSGWTWALPTEAQWEYACRAGNTDLRHGNLDDVAWYDDNSQDRTQEVARKKPNSWGLHDMLGNVTEWCRDWLGDYLQQPLTDPQGPQLGRYRVNRGGSWTSTADSCRSASRTQKIVKTGGFVNRHLSSGGFRLVAVESTTLIHPAYRPDLDDPEMNEQLLSRLVNCMPEFLKKKSQWKIVDHASGETIKRVGYRPDEKGLRRLAQVRNYEEIDVYPKSPLPGFHSDLEDKLVRMEAELAELQRDQLVDQIVRRAMDFVSEFK